MGSLASQIDSKKDRILTISSVSPTFSPGVDCWADISRAHLDPHNIAAALNLGLDRMGDFEYFCFLHDDIIIHDENWLDEYIYFWKDRNYPGSIGLRLHGKDKEFPPRHELFQGYLPWAEVTWSDGILFTSRKVIAKVGRFDEGYVGDCETQDYCYRILKSGLVNFRLLVPHRHYSRRLSDKHDPDGILASKVMESRARFRSIYGNLTLSRNTDDQKYVREGSKLIAVEKDT